MTGWMKRKGGEIEEKKKLYRDEFYASGNLMNEGRFITYIKKKKL